MDGLNGPQSNSNHVLPRQRAALLQTEHLIAST